RWSGSGRGPASDGEDGADGSAGRVPSINPAGAGLAPESAVAGVGSLSGNGDACEAALDSGFGINSAWQRSSQSLRSGSCGESDSIMRNCAWAKASDAPTVAGSRCNLAAIGS